MDHSGTINGMSFKDYSLWDSHCGFETTHDGPLEPLLRPWWEVGVNYLSVNTYFDPQPWTEAERVLASIRKRLPLEVPYCRLISKFDEIESAKVEGKMAITFDIEGMNALNGQPEMVQHYYGLGVRQMVVAYNRNNLMGSGCHDEDIGLTRLGRQVIEEMNRVGMVIDCSHTGYRTTMDVMEYSDHPVIFSHSNPRSLVDHGRNITDEQIRACADTGGVVGITGVNLFLGEEEPSPRTIARHVAYVAELTSPENVGVCLDFDPELEEKNRRGVIDGLLEEGDGTYWPRGAGYDRPVKIMNISRLPEIVKAMEDVGFGDDEISGILAGNFMRIAKQVWR
ncbi:MAG: membrane dipeptidase [Arenicellales bacterium]|nr:membrane dipeptidase [Arenicellales bacterium]